MTGTSDRLPPASLLDKPRAMNTKPIHLTHTAIALRPDQSRVLLRPFTPGDTGRMERIVARVLSVPESQVGPLLDGVLVGFSGRHHNIGDVLRERFDQVHSLLSMNGGLSESRKLLIGSYFTGEYSLESAALFNPSIVPHPDQAGVPAGGLRFILSLRAVGEGHISSIEFRAGVLDANGGIAMDPITRHVVAPDIVPNPTYNKIAFMIKLNEMGFQNVSAEAVMEPLA